jgi:tetratricopeptide (TPR) repeat protein
MMSVHPEGEFNLRNDPFFVNQQIARLVQTFHSSFERILRTHLFFHVFFISIGILELLLFIIFFNFFVAHSLLAFALALIFLTTFSYCILRLYCQTRKPEQLKELKNLFLETSKELLEYQKGNSECHLALADTLCRLSESLDGKENSLYTLPKIFSTFSPYMDHLSGWLHWQDVYNIQEMVLSAAVEEQIQQVKCDATSLDAHTGLANTYILLSQLYMSHTSAGTEESEEKHWKPSKRQEEEIKHKFKLNAQRAIEEFKILSIYAPNDPWWHEQLAYSYCDLQMPLEAIAEYELILKFNPGNSEILYKLGVLYFKLGRNAQGLKIYEQLKRSHYKKAEMLIAEYGAYAPSSHTIGIN